MNLSHRLKEASHFNLFYLFLGLDETFFSPCYTMSIYNYGKVGVRGYDYIREGRLDESGEKGKREQSKRAA